MSQTGQVSDQLAEDITSLAFRLFEAALSNQHGATTKPPEYDNSADVLAAATSAYQRGHITKQQYFAVINALDEATVKTTSRLMSGKLPTQNATYAKPSGTWSRKTDEAFHQRCLAEQKEAQNYLNQYRG